MAIALSVEVVLLHGVVAAQLHPVMVYVLVGVCAQAVVHQPLYCWCVRTHLPSL
jgi:hypothetical protein